MEINDSLRAQLGVPAWRSGFLAASIYFGKAENFLEGLMARLEQSESLSSALKIAVEVRDQRMDQLSEEVDGYCRVQAKCRSCGEYTDMDYDIKDFRQDTHYCGGSEHCCP